MEHKISVSYVSAPAPAPAVSTGSGVQFSQNSQVAELRINGTPVICTGKPNQIVWLPLGSGRVVINEKVQSKQGSAEHITVNPLHVIIPGAVDLVVSLEPAGGTREGSSTNSKPEEG